MDQVMSTMGCAKGIVDEQAVYLLKRSTNSVASTSVVYIYIKAESCKNGCARDLEGPLRKRTVCSGGQPGKVVHE